MTDSNRVSILIPGRESSGSGRNGIPNNQMNDTGQNREIVKSIRRGLTLLELLVVLVILAIVSTIAINSLQPNIDATRFDQTRNQIENIRAAVQGNTAGRQSDGTPLVNGFVADIGRMPRPVTRSRVADSPEGETEELYSLQCSLAQKFPFKFRSGPVQPVDYSEVRIPCGWRGPYLQLASGRPNPTDAWGKPLQYQLDDENQINTISWPARPPYDQGIDVSLRGSRVTVSGSVNSGQSELSELKIVLLTPNPDSSLTELQVLDDEDDMLQSFWFSNVPVGLRALHIQNGSKTQVRYIQVPYGGLSLIVDLDVQMQNPE